MCWGFWDGALDAQGSARIFTILHLKWGEVYQLIKHDKTQVGDNVLDYNPQFMFYITTKLSNPHYTPEVSTKTTIVSWFYWAWERKRSCIALQFLLSTILIQIKSVFCKCNVEYVDGPINCLLGELHRGVGWSDQPAPWCHRPQRRSSFGGRQESLALPSCKRLHDCIKSPRVRWFFLNLLSFSFLLFILFFFFMECQFLLYKNCY